MSRKSLEYIYIYIFRIYTYISILKIMFYRSAVTTFRISGNFNERKTMIQF